GGRRRRSGRGTCAGGRRSGRRAGRRRPAARAGRGTRWCSASHTRRRAAARRARSRTWRGRRGGWRRAWRALLVGLEVLAQQGGGHLELEDLVGALVNAAEAHGGPMTAGGGGGGPAAPPGALAGPGGGVPGGVADEQLGLRRQQLGLPGQVGDAGRRRRGVLGRRRTQQQRLRRHAVHLDRREVLLHELVLADRLAVLDALPGVVD